MLRLKQLYIYKNHLQERYKTLIEMSSNYKFIDEVKSDRAAYKAMKIREKLNRVKYLDREITNSFI